ncbi:sugar ABC transporter permease (plasmid) [Enterococcus avium]|uniref:carbohydrate ABC transporter permease n=1 Tax=Enterococcus TaxID=1350 RepID=UPI000F4D7ACD|nr:MULTISPECIES: sugar ABC transporter permease [Enterococcus]ROY84884.1 sugar ABC transporter permease [Enterococcus gallinarum]
MITQRKSSKYQMIVLMLPGLLIFGIFVVIPIVKLVSNSFLDWTMSSLVSQSFIGLDNFKSVLSDKYFRIAFFNTLMYTLVTVPLQMALGLLAAMLVNRIKRFSVTFRTMFYFPVLTSWVIASLIFKFVFNQEGLLNYFLTDVVHVTSQNINWLSSRWGGITIAMVLGTWKGIGWNMMVFLSALQSIPKELYEASSLDGASTIQQFFKVTIPSIKGTILFSLVMLTIGGFNVYTSIVMITGGGPAHETESVLSWMYYKAFQTGEFGYASALSVIITIGLAILAAVQFKLMKEDN